MTSPLLICLAGLFLVTGGKGIAVVADAQVPVTFTGGYETDVRDMGRPVVLVASALGVPAEVFRDAFSRVKPAPAGERPDPEQVRRNKEALLTTLAPYGVTNERLDEVSNYYRYRRDAGELWRHVPARAVALVRNGVVSGFTVTSAGAGYSSAPEVLVAGMPQVKAVVKLWFGKDLERNGSVVGMELMK